MHDRGTVFLDGVAPAGAVKERVVGTSVIEGLDGPGAIEVVRPFDDREPEVRADREDFRGGAEDAVRLGGGHDGWHGPG